MATLGLTEAAVAPWAAVLDDGERARAARFVFPHSRVTFIAAHALARAALAAAAGVPPAAFAFIAGAHGKPEARLGGHSAGIAFNLSHTDGLVGVAVASIPGLALGFDLEPLARRVPLEVARRCFTGSEVAWLDGLPAPARTEGFVRLWTLKEAFIKATGKGLAQDLAHFWFAVDPPAISFAPEIDERAREWCFVQRVVQARFVAAIGWRGQGAGSETIWREAGAAGFDPAAGLAW
jgi:4'-phosphopantetheinyl transferase